MEKYFRIKLKCEAYIIISVAITTYNGEKFIIEQLQSILEQTRTPDEVIISDDKSTDNTVSIVKEFIKANALANWRLIVNERQKGWHKNFIDTIAMTKGEIIFCSDQDDVWLENKIEIMARAIKENHRILCLSGMVLTIDGEGNEIESKSVNPRKKYNGVIKAIPFSKKFNTITLLGCTMCFTKELAAAIKAVNVDYFAHDEQICRLSTILVGTYIINIPVIKYRIHQNNTSEIVSGIPYGSSSVLKRIDSITKNALWLDAVIKYCKNKNNCKREIVNIMIKTKEFLEARNNFLKSKNIFKFFILMKYLEYYSNLGMYLGDLCYAFGINKLGGKIMWKFRKIFK